MLPMISRMRKLRSSRFRSPGGNADRLVREDNYKEARPWFDPDMLPVLDDYTGSLAKGNNEKTSKHDRARALFHAAWLARNQGMELMGTEAGPDNASGGGEIYGATDIAMERLTGKPHAIEDAAIKRTTETTRPSRSVCPACERHGKGAPHRHQAEP